MRAKKAAAPAKKAASSANQTAALAKKAASATKSASSKKAASATKSARSKKAASATKSATSKKAAPASKGASTRKTSAGKASSSAPSKKTEPAAVASSKFFAAARKRAEKLTKDPEKLQKIAEDSYKSGAARSGSFAVVMDDFRTLVRLVVAYARGHYREIPPDALVVIVAGLVYVVSPVDLIPDVFPGGFADDAAVVVWVVKTVRGELDVFRAWELGADES